MNCGSWACIIIMAVVSVALFYILMSVAMHPNSDFGFWYLTVGNMMYITAFLLAIIGVCLYLYTFQRVKDGQQDHNCQIISIFYLLTLIGIVGISWFCFNYQIEKFPLIGLIIIIIGLLIFAFC